MTSPLPLAHAGLVDSVRAAGCAHHPGWADASVTFRAADGEILGFCLVERDRVTALTSAEVAQSLLCDAPVA